jgi:hypothetical protein
MPRTESRERSQNALPLHAYEEAVVAQLGWVQIKLATLTHQVDAGMFTLIRPPPALHVPGAAPSAAAVRSYRSYPSVSESVSSMSSYDPNEERRQLLRWAEAAVPPKGTSLP